MIAEVCDLCRNQSAEYKCEFCGRIVCDWCVAMPLAGTEFNLCEPCHEEYIDADKGRREYMVEEIEKKKASRSQVSKAGERLHHKLTLKYGYLSGLCVGVLSDSLCILMENHKYNEKDFPIEWEGFPVKTRYVGKIKWQGE